MEVKMPKLGESVHEGTIEQWLVKPGDHVEEYDALCEVITDKVTAEVPSSYTGVIKEIKVEAGETIDVGTVICTMEVEGEVEKENDSDHNKQENHESIQEASENIKNDNQSVSESHNKPKNNGQYSPVVFKLARKMALI